MAQVGRFEFESDRFAVIKEKPIVYWWDKADIKRYREFPKLGSLYPARFGTSTGDNTRFIRYVWELPVFPIVRCDEPFEEVTNSSWQPFINGAKRRKWFEPLLETVQWENLGLECKIHRSSAPCNLAFNLKPGIAFVMIGTAFSARLHRFRSIFGNKGSSVFPQAIENIPSILALMNSAKSKQVMSALNPGIGFEVGDVNRLPLFPIESADEIFAQLDRAFTEHEAARETSVEFKQPGASCWNYAQQWAQQAVDRPAGEPLPDWNPVYEEAPAVNWVSYAVGVALGRFPLTPQPPLPSGEGGQELGAEAIALVPLLPPVPLLPGEKGLGDEGISELAGRERRIPRELLERARELRKQQTVAEEILWNCLRDRQLQNAKFRRQHNIGQIIADFYCHEAKLVIELDGGIQQQRQVEDRDRDTWAVEQGFTVLRFSNQEVFDQIEKVLEQIAQYLLSFPQPPFSQEEAGAEFLPPSP